MRLNELFDVSPAKLGALRERIQKLGLDLGAVEESFARGGGKGGQKINKTESAVRLAYPPLGLSVRVQRERRRTLNRFLALRELVDKIEMRLSPETSERLRATRRLRRRKARREARSRTKYHPP